MISSSNYVCAFISAFTSHHPISQLQKPGRRAAVCGVLTVLVLLAFASSAVAAEIPHGTLSLPLTFEENRGQADAGYNYVFHRDGLEAAFSRNEINFILPGLKADRRKVCLHLIGGDAIPTGEDLLQGRSNYLLGADSSRWIRGVPNYHEIEYKHIYPGISLDFYGNGRELEHDFQVEAGADPSMIAFRLEARSVSI
jgi:hypothetical protein